MVKIIMELVRNRSFTLTTGDSKQSRLCCLENGVPQGLVLAPLLLNIYTYDLPSIISRKFAYADDLTLLHSSGKWKDLEGTLSQDMSTLSAYFQTWRLKFSHTKTVTAAFHLNNREAKRELKVYNNGRLLPFCPTPTYLGVKLDGSLTFRHHLVALRKKLSSRVTLLMRLVGSGWGAGAKTLRIATLSLVYSTAEYCTPVWCRSAHTHLIDSVLNDALRIVTGCLHPTPTDHLPVLSGIHPAELRRLGATLSLAHRGSLDSDHILYGLLSGSSDTRQVRLRFRRPFVPSLPASDLGSVAVWGSKRINPRPHSCLYLTWSGYYSNDDDDDHIESAPTTSHLNVVVQSPSLHWGGSKWLVNSPRVSSSGDSPLDNSSHFLSLLSNARSHVDSTLKPN